MAYIYLNKEDNTLRCFGSISAISKAVNIKPDNLYTNFGRKGLNEFENEYYRIVKVNIERA
jgi:hypothetical protein